MSILILFLLVFFASYLVLLDVFGFAPKKSSRSMKLFHQNREDNTGFFSLAINRMANKLTKFIKLEAENKERLKKKLRIANMQLSPEKFLSLVYIRIALTILMALLFFFVVPLIGIVLIAAGIFLYFEKISEPDRLIKEAREKIEKELPRFCNQLAEEINTTSDVILMFTKYLKSAGKDLERELNITIADMRSGNREVALSRFEGRVSSPMLSEIVRGLIALMRGDDVRTYFATLSYNFRKEEIETLRKEALMVPQKIKKYSFTVAMLFVFLYLIALGGEIMQGFSKLF